MLRSYSREAMPDVVVVKEYPVFKTKLRYRLKSRPRLTSTMSSLKEFSPPSNSSWM